MATYDDWKVFKWYCPNCGELITGHRNTDGEVKGICRKCSSKTFRILRSSNHITIEVYGPKQQVCSSEYEASF